MNNNLESVLSLGFGCKYRLHLQCIEHWKIHDQKKMCAFCQMLFFKLDETKLKIICILCKSEPLVDNHSFCDSCIGLCHSCFDIFYRIKINLNYTLRFNSLSRNDERNFIPCLKFSASQLESCQKSFQNETENVSNFVIIDDLLFARREHFTRIKNSTNHSAKNTEFELFMEKCGKLLFEIHSSCLRNFYPVLKEVKKLVILLGIFEDNIVRYCLSTFINRISYKMFQDNLKKFFNFKVVIPISISDFELALSRTENIFRKSLKNETSIFFLSLKDIV